MRNMENLSANNNSLTGQLPSEWFKYGMFPNLVEADLRWNRLHGPVPKLNNGNQMGPVLYVAPMDEGFSLCVELPTPGQVLRYDNFTAVAAAGHGNEMGPVLYDDYAQQQSLSSSQGGHRHASVAVLPSCPPGTAPDHSLTAGLFQARSLLVTVFTGQHYSHPRTPIVYLICNRHVPSDFMYRYLVSKCEVRIQGYLGVSLCIQEQNLG
jgi:hypothetical protein